MIPRPSRRRSTTSRRNTSNISAPDGGASIMAQQQTTTVAETLATAIAGLRAGQLPQTLRAMADNLVLDGFGTLGAAAAVGAALRLDARQLVDALGIAGSMASGIIEYLADGSWTKRLHPGWAAQAGLRAALLARQGFQGPRTVFEGTHGLFNGFAQSTTGDYQRLTRGFGDGGIAE